MHWWRRRGVRVLILVLAGAAVAVALRGRVPDPATVLAVLRHADPRCLAAAVLAQFLSQAAFAGQQRTLLGALGVAMSPRDALAVTYSRSAMSLVLPAGSAVSAAFAVREYRRHGASTVVAATVMLLSGAASIAGLVLLYTSTIGTAALPRLWDRRAATVVWSVLGAAAVVVLMVTWHRRTPASLIDRRSRWPWLDRVRRQLGHAVREARAVRARDGARTVGFAVLNWLLDLACLIAVARACDFPLSVSYLPAVYLAVQVVRQIPLTPGGIGLIEASLLAGFLAAGAPQSSAAAVVLGYRLISCWLVLPRGLVAYLRLTRDRAPAPADR
ncbi:lysylphosphatidylglycerol synthase transmembrane domain-containing protein [Micromonosporaceae bacterium Da 78-11]